MAIERLRKGSEINKMTNLIQKVNIKRNRYKLFGLPVDNTTLEETKDLLRGGHSEKNPIVLSTININWVAEAHRDKYFQQSILDSDIAVLDGKPLLWFAKLKRLPFTETVPGSTLVEALLLEQSVKQVKIFLLGGEDGVAERAMKKVNRAALGIRIVGAVKAGFGSVEEMSGERLISQINEAKPDLLLIALGAKKGMAWITRNRASLSNVKVVSHLGATINYLAGTVKRAPKWMQYCGLEWLWRIVQEPKLFHRYYSDAKIIIYLIIRGLWKS